jgi:hypothetical protein
METNKERESGNSQTKGRSRRIKKKEEVNIPDDK